MWLRVSCFACVISLRSSTHDRPHHRLNLAWSVNRGLPSSAAPEAPRVKKLLFVVDKEKDKITVNPSADGAAKDGAAKDGSKPAAAGKDDKDAAASKPAAAEATKPNEAGKPAAPPTPAAPLKPTESKPPAESAPKPAAAAPAAEPHAAARQPSPAAPVAAAAVTKAPEPSKPVEQPHKSQQAPVAKAPEPAPLAAAPPAPAAAKPEAAAAPVAEATVEAKKEAPAPAPAAAPATVESKASEEGAAASRPEVKIEAPAEAKVSKFPPLPPGQRRTYEIKYLLQFKSLVTEPPAHAKDTIQFVSVSPAAARPAGMMPPGAAMGGMNGGRGGPMGRPMDPRQGAGPLPARGGPRDMMRGGSGRGRGGMMQAPLNIGPIKPLERSENAYDITKTRAQTHNEKVMKEIRAILNKLTLTNFDKLSDDVVAIELTDPEELKSMVAIIFDKALEEAHFCNMYARLCNKIKDLLPKFPEPDQPGDPGPEPGQEKQPKRELSFKRCLLNKCQEEFERADRYEEIAVEGEDAAQTAAKSRKVRIRMLGNIKFIGELFAQKILNEKIMHECVKRLLASTDEDTIECLCKLMATIGKLLDHPKAKHYMDYYFDQMASTAEVVGKMQNGNRLKFMLRDTIDLRKNSWVPRREQSGPKTIEQIRREAAKEGIVAGPIPPPRGGPMVDPRQRPGDRGQMMGRDGRPMGGGGQMMGGGMGMGMRGQQGGGGRPGDYPGMGIGNRGGGGYGGGDYRDQRMGGGGGPPPASRPGGGVGDTPGERSRPAASGPPPPPAVPEKPKPTVEQMEKRIKSTLEEYLELGEFEEVKLTLQELGSRECFPRVMTESMEMSWDKPSCADKLLPLLDSLYDKAGGCIIKAEELLKGMDQCLEFVEDTAVDIPAAPKVSARFIVAGLKKGYVTWGYVSQSCDAWMKETGFSPRFLGMILKEWAASSGMQEARDAWKSSGLSLASFGVDSEEEFATSNGLDAMFPIPKCEKAVMGMLDAKRPTSEVIGWVEEAFPAPDRDVGQCLMRCVLKAMVSELGGSAKLVGGDDKLIEITEKVALERHVDLLKKFLQKECDQAYALFAVQRFAQDLGYPKGNSKEIPHLI